LKHAQEIANARKELAKRIKSELAKAGIGGSVDEKMGDVTLAFGEEYFDTGSSELKPSMKATLEKFMPGYSKSLFKDDKIANQIENVEIVGFASSTYRGRYVPPDSLKPEDQEAVNHNLKLSFNRANSIFKYIFDTKRMSFEHQRDLLPRIKVVGRGYLPEGKTGKDFPPNGMPEHEFCAKYNCKQAQKVIIKFKLKD
jgi:outer membrane protein OmpA-like peptidoglycan-associated protein